MKFTGAASALLIDSNGDATVDFTERLIGVNSLSAADFVLS